MPPAEDPDQAAPAAPYSKDQHTTARERDKPKHTRSRKGCVRCRHLKKKCDEQLPACARCVLTSSPCQYFAPLYASDRAILPPALPQPALPIPSIPSASISQPSHPPPHQVVHPPQPSAHYTAPPAAQQPRSALRATATTSAEQESNGGGYNPTQPALNLPPMSAGAWASPNFLENPFLAMGAAPWAGYDLSNLGMIATSSAASGPSGTASPGPGSRTRPTSPSPTPPSSTLLDFADLTSWSALYANPSPAPSTSLVPTTASSQQQSNSLIPSPSPTYSFSWPASASPAFITELRDPVPPPRPAQTAAAPKLPFLFAGSSGPRVLPDSKNDAELLSYFSNVTLRTVTAIDDSGNTFAPSFLPLPHSTSPHSVPHSALTHALFSVSLVHSHNFARARRLEDNDFATRAREHRKAALGLLKECARLGEEGEEREDSGGRRPERREVEEMQLTSAAAMLLVLQAVLAGDSKLVPLLLQNAETYVRRLARSVTSPATVNYMVLHSIYVLLNAIVRGESLANKELLWVESEEPGKVLVKTIMGVSKEMLELLGRAHSLIVRQAQLQTATERDADRWEAVEVQAELDTIEGELADEEGWKRKWVDGEKEVRVRLGHEFFRAAIRVYVLRAGFRVPKRDERIQACVRATIRAAHQIPVGSEVGLSWPLLIVGCEALGQDREDLLNFVKRCQWKGSAPPLRVEQVLMGAWNEGKTWQETLEEAGFPLLL